MALDKLVDSSELNADLTSIADAIRSKAGTSSALTFPSGMVYAINNIPSGGDTDAEDGIIQRNISGKYVNNRTTTIGSYAFANCTSLQTASFPACTTIGGSAFYNCTSLQTASFPACTSIGTYAFYGCTSLQTASFSACTSIGSLAFQNCTSLQTASFPACTSIGSDAFYGCSSLQTASFSVCMSIGNYAFAGCTSLQTASFPACTSIGTYAFYACSSLQSVYLLGSSIPTLVNSNTFNNTPLINSTYTGSFGSIIVLESMLNAFKSANVWSIFSARFSIWNGID